MRAPASVLLRENVIRTGKKNVEQTNDKEQIRFGAAIYHSVRLSAKIVNTGSLSISYQSGKRGVS